MADFRIYGDGAGCLDTKADANFFLRSTVESAAIQVYMRVVTFNLFFICHRFSLEPGKKNSIKIMPWI